MKESFKETKVCDYRAISTHTHRLCSSGLAPSHDGEASGGRREDHFEDLKNEESRNDCEQRNLRYGMSGKRKAVECHPNGDKKGALHYLHLR